MESAFVMTEATVTLDHDGKLALVDDMSVTQLQQKPAPVRKVRSGIPLVWVYAFYRVQFTVQ